MYAEVRHRGAFLPASARLDAGGWQAARRLDQRQRAEPR
ncbi:hypothetical protein BZL30_5917 [Mycobacterium kansasii]|uniref:Uncharacterized protein n=1 Tax=Mycobacterium kansasii TaxID=1768 RepID=A0A1V3WXS3_MYCKA|nr:hypothetical protein BZL30_5917 [Mycobacterium kansasii]